MPLCPEASCAPMLTICLLLIIWYITMFTLRVAWLLSLCHYCFSLSPWEPPAWAPCLLYAVMPWLHAIHAWWFCSPYWLLILPLTPYYAFVLLRDVDDAPRRDVDAAAIRPLSPRCVAARACARRSRMFVCSECAKDIAALFIDIFMLSSANALIIIEWADAARAARVLMFSGFARSLLLPDAIILRATLFFLIRALICAMPFFLWWCHMSITLCLLMFLLIWFALVLFRQMLRFRVRYSPPRWCLIMPCFDTLWLLVFARYYSPPCFFSYGLHYDSACLYAIWAPAVAYVLMRAIIDMIFRYMFCRWYAALMPVVCAILRLFALRAYQLRDCHYYAVITPHAPYVGACRLFCYLRCYASRCARAHICAASAFV